MLQPRTSWLQNKRSGFGKGGGRNATIVVLPAVPSRRRLGGSKRAGAWDRELLPALCCKGRVDEATGDPI